MFNPGLPLYQLQIAHKDQVENRHQQKGDESRRLTRRSVANISPLWRRPPVRGPEQQDGLGRRRSLTGPPSSPAFVSGTMTGCIFPRRSQVDVGGPALDAGGLDAPADRPVGRSGNRPAPGGVGRHGGNFLASAERHLDVKPGCLSAVLLQGPGVLPELRRPAHDRRAAQLVDRVIPPVPVRQWVLTLPFRLRYLLAWDHGLRRAVLAVHARRCSTSIVSRLQRQGLATGRTGSVTAVQRFGGGLNLNVHFHTLALDGVFVRSPGGRLAFHAACGPSDAEVAEVLTRIRRRVGRLLRRRSLVPDADGMGGADPVAEVSLTLAGIVGASVQGRVALGVRAEAPVRRLGGRSSQARDGARGPRHAHLDGFDLHANVWVRPTDRARLEQLCRYVLRPPLAENRLRRLADGQVRLELKRAWSDGTTHLRFEPLEFLEKLAALTPRPEIDLVLYHGVLAPHARWRPAVVAYGRGDGGHWIQARQWLRRGAHAQARHATGRGRHSCAGRSTWTSCTVRAAPGGCSSSPRSRTRLSFNGSSPISDSRAPRTARRLRVPRRQ